MDYEISHHVERTKMKSVYNIDYQFDDNILWKEYNRMCDSNPNSPAYEYIRNGEMISKQYNELKVLGSLIYGEDADTLMMAEGKKFCKYYSIGDDIVVKFMKMTSGFELGWHIDDLRVCKSSVNYIMSPDPAPIKFEDGEYTYKCAVLDITKKHSVYTPIDRLLFRISFRTYSFEKIIEHIQKKNEISL